MGEQLYKFIDKTGKCFEAFQDIGEIEYDNNGKAYGEGVYNNYVGALLRASHHKGYTFGIGDMMCFKQDLLDAGFEWGKDFYIVKAV